MMDNFYINIVCSGKKKALEDALVFAFTYSNHSQAVGYAIREACAGETDGNGRWLYGREPRPQRLVLYWTEYERATDLQMFPTEMSAKDVCEFAYRWLETVEYEEEPDIDGHNKKGFRLYNEAWGHVDNHFGAFVAISPEWAMYGK